MSIFCEGYTEARRAQDLGNYLPKGFRSLEELDAFCIEQQDSGRLVVVDHSPKIRWAIKELRSTNVGMEAFRELLTGLTNNLFDNPELMEYVQPPNSAKVAISIRAGLAFLPTVMTQNVEIGMITQERDETEPTKVTSLPRKLGSFVDKTAIIVDPMLATGGSMSDVVRAVCDRGADTVVTVSAFSAPQGIVRMLQDGRVDRVFTPPLEAGLNEHAFIVGGYGQMLGDCGDRYFGPVGD